VTRSKNLTRNIEISKNPSAIRSNISTRENFETGKFKRSKADRRALEEAEKFLSASRFRKK
jgi:hypothetical protein